MQVLLIILEIKFCAHVFVVCCVSVSTACAHHVDATQVSARLHVFAPRATQTCSPLHGNSDCLSHWTVGHKNYQANFNHISCHGLYHCFSLW